MSGRPTKFTLKTSNTLYSGLIFAGLGYSPGTSTYTDSTGNANGTLKGFTGTGNLPANQWSLDSTLGRYCLNFNGSTDYVDCGLPAFLTGLTVATLTGWANCTAEVGNNAILSNDTTGGAGGRDIRISGYDYQAYQGSAFLDIGSIQSYQSTWVHLLSIFNGTAVSSYVNGVRKGSGTVGTYSPAGYNLGVGWRPGSSSFYFTGKIADAMIWNRALTSGEITTLANASDPTLGGLIITTNVDTIFFGST